MTVVPDTKAVPNVVPVLNRWTANAKGLAGFGLIWVVGVVFVALTPIAVPLIAISDVIRKSKWGGVRTWRFIVSYLVITLLSSIVTAFHGLVFPFCSRELRWTWCWGIQRWWAKHVSHALFSRFKLTMETQGLDNMPEEPVIMLARHVSMADTVLPLWLYSVPRKTRFRYVLKEELLWEGVFNFVGRRMPTVFVRRGSDRKEAEVERVAELAVGLHENSGVVIYPEGTRFTQAKMDRIKEKLKDHAHAPLREHTQRMNYMLPLRTAGAIAVMNKAKDAHMVFLGHEGFDKARTFRNLWGGVLVGQKIRVKLWFVDRSEVPEDSAAMEQWLFEQWEQVDHWVGEKKEERNAK